MKYKVLFLIIIVVILVILVILTAYRFVNFNKVVHQWHCDNIYSFHEKLTEKENKYINECISMSYWELLRPFYAIYDPFIKRLSYFTYSHRIVNGILNSSRIAYGSVINPGKAYIAAQSVLDERKIQCEITINDNIVFGGLGWDIDNGHFKVYYRFFNYKDLNSYYKYLLPETNNKCDSGIISITYDSNGKILERKIYCYPKNEMIAKLKSQLREDIQQDCTGNEKWELKLNRTGKKILKLYKKNGYKLDAITFKDKMNYTIYFPMIG